MKRAALARPEFGFAENGPPRGENRVLARFSYPLTEIVHLHNQDLKLQEKGKSNETTLDDLCCVISADECLRGARVGADYSQR